MRSPVITPADGVARQHYEAQQLLAARAAAVASDLWSSVDRTTIATSWALRIPHTTVVVTAMQRLAAGLADGYVHEALKVAGTDKEAQARLVPAAFSGTASDGRELEGLLAQPAIATLRSIGAGGDVDNAMLVGLRSLQRIIVTQVADAGRVADGVAVISRPGVGYVRMLVPPACSRCAVLAGRRYRASQAFLRHPRCDCRHIPVAETEKDVTTDSRRYFDSLSKSQQDRIFTQDGARAIRDGGDIGQVVNARRGMSSAGTTTEGTTRRGFAGKRFGGDFRKVEGGRYRRSNRQRLMPEQIYRQANGRRDVAMDLLRENGFIV